MVASDTGGVTAGRQASSTGPTLADVAARAGVTVPTVSKVLNSRTDVSAATRQRVMDAAAAVGYKGVPRGRPAPAPVEGEVHTSLVDLVMGGVEGSWANSVLSGVEEAARDVDRDVVVTLARPSDPPTRSWVQRLVDRRSRGAVLALVRAADVERARLAAAGIPVVLLDPDVEPPPGVPSVGATNWTGGHSAASHLLELGHRRFAVISGPRGQLSSRARVDGFRCAVEGVGLAVPDEAVAPGNWTREAAAVAAGRLLDAPVAPTAVFACSDWMALGVYDAAAARSLRIPADLSVVGFDDLPEARWLQPALTTVRQPVSEMAATALRLLLRICDGDGSGDPVRMELSTKLVVRGSTAPPADVMG
jgi:LacI family transcriptional regulator